MHIHMHEDDSDSRRRFGCKSPGGYREQRENAPDSFGTRGTDSRRSCSPFSRSWRHRAVGQSRPETTEHRNSSEMNVLVDASVWIDHLHRSDSELVALLQASEVVMRSAILGELACGTLPNRRELLSLWSVL